MNIIFLDIDGVMNHDGHLVRSNKHGDLEWSPESVLYLKEILDKTESKIVVSSTHGIGETVESINTEFFIHYDLDKYVVGITLHLGKFCGERGLEIQKYIDDSIGTMYEVEKFIIIDDDDDMNHLMDRLVLCRQDDGLRGLLQKQRNEALELMSI